MEAQGYLPSGGWGWGWIGDPDYGFGANQPGSWLYSILPYIDQAALHDLALTSTDPKVKSLANMAMTPLAVANCPSRRRSVLFPQSDVVASENCPRTVAGVARSDYAGNMGGQYYQYTFPTGPVKGSEASYPNDVQKSVNPNKSFNGVIFVCSQIKVSQIPDGTSNTILFAEKSLDSDFYYSTPSNSDKTNMYVGIVDDLVRFTSFVPMQDRSGLDKLSYSSTWFGSCHPNGINIAFCDGSVRRVGFSIDPAVFLALGSRAGCRQNPPETPIDFSKIP